MADVIVDGDRVSRMVRLMLHDEQLDCSDICMLVAETQHKTSGTFREFSEAIVLVVRSAREMAKLDAPFHSSPEADALLAAVLPRRRRKRKKAAPPKPDLFTP
jgi:hypothetical protein